MNQTYDVFSELSLEASSGKATPDLASYPAIQDDWERDEAKVKAAPLQRYRRKNPRRLFSRQRQIVLEYHSAAENRSRLLSQFTDKNLYHRRDY